MKYLLLLLSVMCMGGCKNSVEPEPDYFDSCMIVARQQRDSHYLWYDKAMIYRDAAWMVVKQRDSVIKLLEAERAKPKHFNHVETLIQK
jgi:hypothetical protein